MSEVPIKFISVSEIDDLIDGIGNDTKRIVPSSSTPKERKQISRIIKRHRKNKRFIKRIIFISSKRGNKIKILQKIFKHNLWLKKIKSEENEYKIFR